MASGDIAASAAVKVPTTPMASGEYILVIIGVKPMVIAWAPAAPVATIATFLMK
ncbi:hypothetical protein D3C81_1845720 [compost metagenome]